jgi:hypothetical protein
MTKLGRPTDYTEALLEKADEYINNCPDSTYSVVGLCSFIGIAKCTAYRWVAEGNKGFEDVLNRVNEKQEMQLIENGLSGAYNSTITKMMLTKHGYSDKIEQDVTSGGKALNTWIINPVTTSNNK